MRHEVDKVNQSGAETDDEALFELLHTVMHRFRALLTEAIAEDESGLAVMETRALGFLAGHPGATPSDLVKRSGRDKAQVARLLAELTERGLVERRVPEGGDRRSHTVYLTPEGKAVHRRLEKRRIRVAAAMFAPFTAPERATLARLLQRIAYD